jgi:hypothetical protein
MKTMQTVSRYNASFIWTDPLGRWCLRKRVAARIEWQRPCGAVYRVEVS